MVRCRPTTTSWSYFSINEPIAGVENAISRQEITLDCSGPSTTTWRSPFTAFSSRAATPRRPSVPRMTIQVTIHAARFGSGSRSPIRPLAAKIGVPSALVMTRRAEKLSKRVAPLAADPALEHRKKATFLVETKIGRDEAILVRESARLDPEPITLARIIHAWRPI